MLFVGSTSRQQEDRQIWQAFRHHSRTFSLAARLLPQPVRMPVATLYLFCRTIDEIADDRVLTVGAAQALDEVRTARVHLDRTLRGQPPEKLLWRRLADVHARYPLNVPPLYELLDGATWDLEGRTVETEDDLIQYSNLVGGSVGAMMLPFLTESGTSYADLDRPARAIGIAMQITNILRDVGDDYRTLGRVYLPTELLRTHGLSLDRLVIDGPTPAYRDLIEHLMARAEALYAEGLPGIQALPKGVRTGIRSAARMYRGILNEVRARRYNNLSQRAYVRLPRKLRLVVQDDYTRRKRRLVSPAVA